MPDLLPPAVVNWFMQDPWKAFAIVLCSGLAIWALLNPNTTTGGGDVSLWDSSDSGGDGGGD